MTGLAAMMNQTSSCCGYAAAASSAHIVQNVDTAVAVSIFVPGGIRFLTEI